MHFCSSIIEAIMEKTTQKQRAQHNRTISLSDKDMKCLTKRLIKLHQPTAFQQIENSTIHQDIFEALKHLPDRFVDLLFVDPPYNLNKNFHLSSFKAMDSEKYAAWLDSWLQKNYSYFKAQGFSLYLWGLEGLRNNFSCGKKILSYAKSYYF